MSSSNDLFGPEDFENLIAAVDSLDIPSDDESTSSRGLTSFSDNATSQSETSSSSSLSTNTSFEIEDDPFGNESASFSMQANEDDEFIELDNLASDFSELDFNDEPRASSAFSPTTDFSTTSKSTVNKGLSLEASPGKTSQVSKFAVDDPFDSQTNPETSGSTVRKTTTEPFDAIDAIDDEDDLVDVYASFLEATDDNPKPVSPAQSKASESNIFDDDFSDFTSLAEEKPAVDKTINYFAFEDEEDNAEKFDGIEAANEISALWNEDQTNIEQPSLTFSVSNESVQEEPLKSSMAKTKMAADKLKAHLASLSVQTASVNPDSSIPLSTKPQTPADPVPLVVQQSGSFDNPVVDIDPSDIDPEFADLATHAVFEQPDFRTQQTVRDEPVAKPSRVLSESVSEKIKETVSLSRKTEELSDDLLTAFVESALSSKQKIRFLSAQNIARKFPRFYLGCTTLLALAGFVYILAIPALLVVTMFNGFEMLNSPFTNNVLMLLLALFSISLFLFMVGYKLMDLKFVGPGGITLNHENAGALIDKIHKLKEERAIPKIHEIVLTRRHELNLIKIPRFGLPIWSKNVLAIGYPLLQTLPPEYFDVALLRRLTQFNKRKNLLHNWISFMRRTWTIYAISLKERKGVIDLLHYCFFAPYASLYRSFAVYISQKDELLADEKALQHCNDRDLVKTAQTLRITRAMLLQYFWPKLNEDLQSNTAAPHYVQPYSKLPDTLNTLLRSKNVDAWFIRLGQEETNPGDPEAPFALRMKALAQRKVAIPDAFEANAAQHYFGEQYDKMTDLLNTLWAEEVQKELFEKNIHNGSADTSLPCHLAIEPA